MTEVTEQLSVADAFHAFPEWTYVQPTLVVTDWSPVTPQVITGGSSSVTVTVNEHVDVRPEPSVAVHVTVVVPRLKATLLSVVPEPVVASVSV
jgi:hypothetical protein